MEKITLIVNGENISLSDFPRQIIIRTILGMVSALKGIEDVKSVEIKIEN